MPERPRVPGSIYKPYEAVRKTEGAVDATAEVARRPGVDPQHIACDLTDRLNRRLFGVAFRLQDALAHIQDPYAAQQVQAALDDLDVAITELRRDIFDLHTAFETLVHQR